MSESWFIWSAENLLFMYFASIGVYFFMTVKDDTDKKKAFWIGLAITVFGFVLVGLYSLIIVALYLNTVWIIEHYRKKAKLSGWKLEVEQQPCHGLPKKRIYKKPEKIHYTQELEIALIFSAIMNIVLIVTLLILLVTR